MLYSVTSPILSSPDALSALLQQLGQTVWLDGFWRGAVSAACILLFTLCLVLCFRKP